MKKLIGWFYLGQGFKESMDFFFILLLGVLVTFFSYALKGVPSHFPVSLTKLEKIIFYIGLPLFSGTITLVFVFFTQKNFQWIRSGGIFLGTVGIVSLLLGLYTGLGRLWEKKNLDDNEDLTR